VHLKEALLKTAQGMSPEQIKRMNALRQQAASATVRARAAALKAGKTPAEANQIGAAAGRKLVTGYVQGKGVWEGLTGGGRAQEIESYGNYLRTLTPEQRRIQFSPEDRRIMSESDPKYRMATTAAPAVNTVVDAAERGKQMVKGMFGMNDGAQPAQPSKAIDPDLEVSKQFNQGFMSGTKGAYDKYKTERNKKIGDWMKGNWGKLAIGAGGLLLAGGLFGGDKPQQQAQAQQNPQNPNWWAANRNFRRPQPQRGSAFTNFMNNMRV